MQGHSTGRQEQQRVHSFELTPEAKRPSAKPGRLKVTTGARFYHRAHCAKRWNTHLLSTKVLVKHRFNGSKGALAPRAPRETPVPWSRSPRTPARHAPP